MDILYETLRHIYERRENSMRKEKLLYLYMIIKNRFRSELVQCNNDVDFDNFSLYQKRKGWFIQKEMQHQISIQGIGIETNPSSNVFISTISDYSEHPITTFFDKGISANPNFHQLNISINTDDKSVFSTSISNEYAYLAFYLENARNADGEPLYSRFDIFEWLDAIRRNGNEQSFIQNDF